MVAGVDFGDAQFAQDVRDGVARIETLMSDELGRADALMAEAVQHLFQAGGKRFRPLFTVLSAQLGPEPDAWQVSVAGAVIELVHLATLYHDDVMDEAQMRRGATSANARWGNNIAILAGDYLFATASRLRIWLAENPHEPPTRARTLMPKESVLCTWVMVCSLVPMASNWVLITRPSA